MLDASVVGVGSSTQKETVEKWESGRDEQEHYSNFHYRGQF